MTPGRFEPFGGQPVWAAKRRKRRNKEGIHRPDSRPHRRVVTPCEVTSKRVKSTCALNRSPGSSERIPISRLHPPYPHCYTRKSCFFGTTPPSHTIGACPCAIRGIRGEPRSIPERLWPSRFRHGPGSPDPGYRRNAFIRVDSCPFVVPTHRFRSDPPESASIRVDPWLPHAKPCRDAFRPVEP